MATLKSTDGPLREIALFAGGGGGILGATLLGHRVVCAVELDAFAAGRLVARQNDGSLPAFPVWDNVCTFDGRPWRGRVDVLSAGFPCQDISAAGSGRGLDGERSGLYFEIPRIIREVGPGIVLLENSPVLTSRGLGTVLGDLAEMGYGARWGVVGADDAAWACGDPVADHERDRIWIVGFRDPSYCNEGGRAPAVSAEAADTDGGKRNGGTDDTGRGKKRRATSRRGRESAEPPAADTDFLLR